MGGSYLFDGGFAGMAITRFASDYHVPGIEAAASRTHIRLEQTKITSKGEFRPYSVAIYAVRYWAGYTDYKHDELGFNGLGFEQINGTFRNNEKEGKVEVEMHADAHADRGPDQHRRIAGRPQPARHLRRGAAVPGPHRSAAGYFFNEMQHTDTLRTQLAGRIESVNVTGTAVDVPGEFPAAAGRSGRLRQPT